MMRVLFVVLGLILPSIALASETKCYVTSEKDQADNYVVYCVQGFIPPNVLCESPKDGQGKYARKGEDIEVKTSSGKSVCSIDQSKRTARLEREQQRKDSQEAKEQAKKAKLDKAKDTCSKAKGEIKDICDYLMEE